VEEEKWRTGARPPTPCYALMGSWLAALGKASSPQGGEVTVCPNAACGLAVLAVEHHEQPFRPLLG
jgi:hypothetical protein